MSIKNPPYVSVSPTIVLGEEWQWVNSPLSHVKQWRLGWTKEPTVVYASIVKVEAPIQSTSGPAYQVVIRNTRNVEVFTPIYHDLYDAMIAAENFVAVMQHEIYPINNCLKDLT